MMTTESELCKILNQRIEQNERLTPPGELAPLAVTERADFALHNPLSRFATAPPTSRWRLSWNADNRFKPLQDFEIAYCTNERLLLEEKLSPQVTDEV